LPFLSLLKNQLNGAAIVLNIYPVSHIRKVLIPIAKTDSTIEFSMSKRLLWSAS
jgi:hypothetical protein